jgi:hypothetical protein
MHRWLVMYLLLNEKTLWALSKKQSAGAENCALFRDKEILCGLSFGFLTLMMGPIICPETSLKNYHDSLCNDPEERSSRLLRDGSLQSRTAGVDPAVVAWVG